MKKLLLLIISALITLTPAHAEGQLNEPLRFVEADSVVFLSQDMSNYRLMALTLDSTVLSLPFTPKKYSRKAFEKHTKAWQAHLANHFNLVGGAGHEDKEPQRSAAIAALYASAELFLQTGSAQYANAIERIAQNALPTALGARSKAERKVGARALIDAAGMIYATDEDGVYVNLYTNSFARIHTPRLAFSLDVQTMMPYEARVKIRVGGLKSGRHHFKLHLLIPEWCNAQISPTERYAASAQGTERLVVYINGRDEELQVRDGYVVVERAWRNGEEVYFDLPFPILTIKNKLAEDYAQGCVALQRGPLVYALTQPSEDFGLDMRQKIEVDYSGQVADVPCLSGGLKEKESTSERAEVLGKKFVAVPYSLFPGQVWIPVAE